MKPRTKGQSPLGLQNLVSLPSASCSFGVALVSVFWDMASAKIPEECPGEDSSCGWLSAVCLGSSERTLRRGLWFCCFRYCYRREFHVAPAPLLAWAIG